MWKPVLKRLGRVAVSTALSMLVVKETNQPEYIGLIPAISTIGKLIREKWNWTWLPF
jgi:hypothetical protein